MRERYFIFLQNEAKKGQRSAATVCVWVCVWASCEGGTLMNKSREEKNKRRQSEWSVCYTPSLIIA